MRRTGLGAARTAGCYELEVDAAFVDGEAGFGSFFDSFFAGGGEGGDDDDGDESDEDDDEDSDDEDSDDEDGAADSAGLARESLR